MNESKVRDKMQEVIDIVTSDISTVRTGKATPSLVEDLEVLVYGGREKLKLNELATISTTDPQTIVIDPWDKSIIGEIRKGIETSGIGLSPSIGSEVIRINLPPMTSEDREKYVKLLSTKLENGKVMIRQIRGEALKEIRSDFEEKDLTEDEKFNFEKILQEITDSFIEKIEELGRSKEEELVRI